MTAPYLGGFSITAVGWLSSHAIIVVFASSYGRSYNYQLYAGRTLIGTTTSPGERKIVGSLKPSVWPQPLTLMAVAPAQRTTDYGASLPLRPYNKAKFVFSTSSWPDDAEFIELTGGTEPGGAVDTDTILERIPFDTDGEFEIFSPPMPGSGTWNFELAGRDNRPPEGNRGTALALQADLLAHPPDVQLNSDDSRLSVAVSGGTATVTFTNPS